MSRGCDLLGTHAKLLDDDPSQLLPNLTLVWRLAALFERFSSRNLDEFGDKVLSAMRKQFGGHDEKKS